MELKKLTLEELQELSMVDIAHMILTESDKKFKIKTVFNKIAKLLELNEEEQLNKIGDFYTAISTDKRFIILNNGNIDLKAKHSVQKVKVEDDTDDIEDFIEDDTEDIEEVETEEDEYNSIKDDDDDVYDDEEDLKDLVIIDEEDMNN